MTFQKTLTQKAVVVFETKMRHLARRFIFQQEYHHVCGAVCLVLRKNSDSNGSLNMSHGFNLSS